MSWNSAAIRRLKTAYRLLNCRVAWCVPQWGLQEFKASLLLTTTGRLVHGSNPDRFASEVAQAVGRRYAVPFNRGRFVIEVILRGLGIGEGDDVVVPSYVCSTALYGILATGARPRYADVGEDLNVSVETVLQALTPRTKCVVVPHLFGRPARIDEIESAMSKRGIAVIDDAAQSFGATLGSRTVGSFGVAGVVACGPGKFLSGAAGGVLVTDDLNLYEFALSKAHSEESSRLVVRRLLEHWLFRRARRLTLAFAYLLDSFERPPSAEPLARMSNLDAAIGSIQLAKASRLTAKRKANAETTAAVFAEVGIRYLDNLSTNHVALKLVLLLPEEGVTASKVIEILADAGVESQSGYVPCHVTGTSSVETMDVRLPVTNALWKRVVCVPIETTVSPNRLRQFALRLRIQPS